MFEFSIWEGVDRAHEVSRMIEEAHAVGEVAFVDIHAFRSGRDGRLVAAEALVGRMKEALLEARLQPQGDAEGEAVLVIHVLFLVVFSIPNEGLLQGILLERRRHMGTEHAAGQVPDDLALSVLDGHGGVAPGLGREGDLDPVARARDARLFRKLEYFLALYLVNIEVPGLEPCRGCAEQERGNHALGHACAIAHWSAGEIGPRGFDQTDASHVLPLCGFLCHRSRYFAASGRSFSAMRSSAW